MPRSPKACGYRNVNWSACAVSVCTQLRRAGCRFLSGLWFLGRSSVTDFGILPVLRSPGTRAKDRASWVISSVVERFVHIEDVGGSNPSSPTMKPKSYVSPAQCRAGHGVHGNDRARLPGTAVVEAEVDDAPLDVLTVSGEIKDSARACNLSETDDKGQPLNKHGGISERFAKLRRIRSLR